MDSVCNATFRIAFRRIVSPCAPFAVSRLVDTMRLLYILKWQCPPQRANRAYRTLRGAFFISENGNAHFQKASCFNGARQI